MAHHLYLYTKLKVRGTVCWCKRIHGTYVYHQNVSVYVKYATRHTKSVKWCENYENGRIDLIVNVDLKHTSVIFFKKIAKEIIKIIPVTQKVLTLVNRMRII